MTTPDWVKRAKVGDKVVCVCTPTRSTSGHLKSPIELRKVYQIEAVSKNSWANCGIELKLVGVDRAYFCALLFKPLETRKTDISIFKQMLKPSKVDA